MFYLAVILHGVAARLSPDFEPLTLRQAIMAATFTFGFGVHAINAVAIGGWSVAVETTFYLLTPLLFTRLRSFWSAAMTLSIAAPLLYVACTAIGARSNAAVNEYLTFFWFPVQFPVFVMGIATFWAAKQIDAAVVSESDRRRLSMLMLASSAALLVLGVPSSNRNLYTTSLAFPLLVLAVRLVAWPAIVNRVTLKLGTISYSLYLLHFYAAYLARDVLLSIERNVGVRLDGTVAGAVEVGAVTLLLAVPTSWATHRWVEKPFIDLSHRWAGRLRSTKGGNDGKRPVRVSA